MAIELAQPTTYKPTQRLLSNIAVSALSQVCAFGVGLAASDYVGTLPALFFQFATAWTICAWLNLSLPWCLFNACLGPLVMSESQLPTWIFASGAVVAVILYLPTAWTRVPYYPTNPKLYAQILELLPADREITVADLGSGFGGLLDYVSARRPRARLVGYELSPLAYLVSKIWLGMRRPHHIRIRFQDFWQVPLDDFDVVYAFLSPEPMASLWQKCLAEMKPGSMFISNSFPAPAKASATLAGPSQRQAAIYIYKF